ncbi:hypothetical protein [Streptomyces sp. NPDC054756]
MAWAYATTAGEALPHGGTTGQAHRRTTGTTGADEHDAHHPAP